MTEPTIAEVLEKYPDCKEFLDAKGQTWSRHDIAATGIFSDYQRFVVAIPGLRPKPQKRKVTVDGYTSLTARSGSLIRFQTNQSGSCDVPAILTYETDADTEPSHIDDAKIYSQFNSSIHIKDPTLQVGFKTSKNKGFDHFQCSTHMLKPDTDYLVTFNEVENG